MKSTTKSVLSEYGKYLMGDNPGVHLREIAFEDEIKMAREIARLRNLTVKLQERIEWHKLSGAFR